MRHRPARTDDNQPQIVKELRKIPGFSVAITAAVGNGFVDIVVGHRGINGMYEIKDPTKEPARRKLTPAEKDFHRDWHGQVAVAETTVAIVTDMRAMANRRAA